MIAELLNSSVACFPHLSGVSMLRTFTVTHSHIHSNYYLITIYQIFVMLLIMIQALVHVFEIHQRCKQATVPVLVTLTFQLLGWELGEHGDGKTSCQKNSVQHSIWINGQFFQFCCVHFQLAVLILQMFSLYQYLSNSHVLGLGGRDQTSTR